MITPRKRANLLATYSGFCGDRTLSAVLAQLPPALVERLTGAELGHVASALDAAYHAGRASTQASIEDDCVWIGGRVQRLIPLDELPAVRA